MAFLSVLVTLMARLTGISPAKSHAPTRFLFTIAAGLAYLQIVMGAVVRHTGAALACPDWPLCSGIAWPDAFLQRVQMVHRAAAVLVLVLVLASVAIAWRAGSLVPRRAFVLAPGALVMVQIVLGLAVVSSGAPLPLVTAHHANGAVLLASLMLARASC
jgi:cytochrome c oxidase assembly protein subunit 15